MLPFKTPASSFIEGVDCIEDALKVEAESDAKWTAI